MKGLMIYFFTQALVSGIQLDLYHALVTYNIIFYILPLMGFPSST
jgi:hypothetical protein